MNDIERLREHLSKYHPSASLDLIRPLQKDGFWTLDISFRGDARLGPKQIHIQWNREHGFGITSVLTEGMSDGSDEMYRSLEQARTRLDTLLTAEERTAPRAEVLLARLRNERGKTQQELAAQLGMKQATISGIERRSDVQVSTLTKYVMGLGGCLEIFAQFSDVKYRLTFDTIERCTSSNQMNPIAVKRRSVTQRNMHVPLAAFKQLRKAGHLKDAVESAERVKQRKSIFEMS